MLDRSLMEQQRTGKKMREPYYSVFFMLMFFKIFMASAEIIEDEPSSCENLLQGDPASWNDCYQTGNWSTGLELKCVSQAGKAAHDKFEEEMTNFKECFGKNFDFAAIREEKELAELEGKIDSFLENYCKRVPAFHACLRPVHDAYRSCLNDKEKVDLKHMVAAINASLDFICHTDGDRIALFLSEDGLECLSNNHESLLNCSSDFSGTKFDPSAFSGTEVISFDEESCAKYNFFRECFSSALTTCPDPTPGNLAESLMTAALKSTPCEVKSLSSNLSVSLATVLLAGLMLLVKQ